MANDSILKSLKDLITALEEDLEKREASAAAVKINEMKPTLAELLETDVINKIVEAAPEHDWHMLTATAPDPANEDKAATLILKHNQEVAAVVIMEDAEEDPTEIQFAVHVQTFGIANRTDEEANASLQFIKHIIIDACEKIMDTRK